MGNAERAKLLGGLVMHKIRFLRSSPQQNILKIHFGLVGSQ